MFTKGCIAPSYEELRPLKPPTTATFPVYRDLTGLLMAPGSHPDRTAAHVLATCSGYAYGDEETVAMIMARMGLDENRCQRIEQSVDAMLIRANAFLVQSVDGRVAILCFRGTGPTDLINWLVDVDVDPEKVPISFGDEKREFEVHAGFYRNVRAIRPVIIRRLQRALAGSSVLDDRDDPGDEGGVRKVHPLEALYVTGHSLGGAMAVLMAIMLVTEKAYADIAAKLKGTYTFGQPMVGSPDLAAACNAHPTLGRDVVRYVYGTDVIPKLPPAFAGKFAHFGPEYRYRGARPGGRWERSPQPTKQLRQLLHLLSAPLAFFARQVRVTRDLKFRASFHDHFPRRYITALTPAGKSTEFGD
jgi:hypothetical protein